MYVQLSGLFSNVLVASLTLLFCYVVKFYVELRHYPPGPFPLPFLGNFYLFLRGGHGYKNILALRKKYGNTFTVWMATRPMVFVCDLKDAVDAFKEKTDDFAGKHWPGIKNIILGEKGTDVIIADNTREWEALRKLMHAAVRKFAMKETHPQLVANAVGEAISIIKKKHGIKPWHPADYTYLIMFNILAETAYGQRYSAEDQEFVKLKNMSYELARAFPTVIIADNLPIMKFLLHHHHNHVTRLTAEFREMILSKFTEHLATYKEGQVRDFCDALIAAKVEAQVEQKENVPYLTDVNLSLTVLDLFFAGTDTTRETTTWLILFLANYPDWQQKLREEVDKMIGDVVASHAHRSRCHLVSAFISETLRFRSVVPINVGHQATCDSEIGGHAIKKGTSVNLCQEEILHDPQHWESPQLFNPARFLDKDGHFEKKKKGFVTFGLGRRSCVGEKLAQATLFFITCRLLQGTRGYRIVLPDGPGSVDLYGDTSVKFILAAVPYEVCLEPIK